MHSRPVIIKMLLSLLLWTLTVSARSEDMKVYMNDTRVTYAVGGQQVRCVGRV